MKKQVMKFCLMSILLSLTMVEVGCNSFRAQVGTGVGFGVMIKIPGISHIGFCAGEFSHVGYDYGRGWCSRERVISVVTAAEWRWICRCLLFYHVETLGTKPGVIFFEDGTTGLGRWQLTDPLHTCYMVLPPAFECSNATDDICGNWSLEVVIMVVLIDIRLGFNPTYISKSIGAEGDVWVSSS